MNIEDMGDLSEEFVRMRHAIEVAFAAPGVMPRESAKWGRRIWEDEPKEGKPHTRWVQVWVKVRDTNHALRDHVDSFDSKLLMETERNLLSLMWIAALHRAAGETKYVAEDGKSLTIAEGAASARHAFGAVVKPLDRINHSLVVGRRGEARLRLVWSET